MKRTISIPVAIVVFNRLDCVKINLKAIRAAEPPRLYVISDGPRDGVDGEVERVNDVRKYIENNIDWDCSLIKIYAENNMGCDKRSISGYNEVFMHEEMAILIEDDAIPAWSFFPYCEQMLKYYKDTPKIMMVAGLNRVPFYETDSDYMFSAVPGKLAWGTWKRAWDKFAQVSSGDFDYDVEWIKKSLPKQLYWFFASKMIRCKMRLSDSWDAVWDCTIFANEGLGIVPKYNLISYIGANREDATHHLGDVTEAHLPTDNFDDKIRIRNENVCHDKKYDEIHAKYMIKGTYLFYVRSLIAYFVYCHFPEIYKKLSKLF